MDNNYFFTLNECQKINELTIMIIGGAGFIGSHISQLLVAHKIKKVIVIDYLSNDNRNIRKIHSLLNKDNFDFYKIKITGELDDKILEIFENEEIDIVLYLANNSTNYYLSQYPNKITKELNKFISVLEITKDWCNNFAFVSHILPQNNVLNFKCTLDKCCQNIANLYSNKLTITELQLPNIFGPDQKYKLEDDEDISEIPIIPRIIMNKKEKIELDLPKNINLCFIEDCTVNIIKKLLELKSLNNSFNIHNIDYVNYNTELIIEIIDKLMTNKNINRIKFELKNKFQENTKIIKFNNLILENLAKTTKYYKLIDNYKNKLINNNLN